MEKALTLQERMDLRKRILQEQDTRRIMETYNRWARADRKKYGFVTQMTAWKAQKLLNIDCDYREGQDDGCDLEVREHE